ncbi:MAG: YfhO family protein, partial [Tannerellaceae bacterium]|nr:YfhO family protein [Tannerellaceae bacterium]
GAILFILSIALSLLEGHPQITYYLAIFCLFIYLGFACREILEKRYADLLKITGIMAVCVAIAVLPNLSNLYTNFEMSKTSLRGPTELTQASSADGKERPSFGLDKDYAFDWSYGVKELVTLLIPNVYGGESGGSLDSSSELYKEYKKNGMQTSGDKIQAPTYWGDKLFTSGPVYFGALICFLFILGMFVIRNPVKWWILAGSIFFICLSLGRNFDLFNDFIFHTLPGYNKFRTVEMALVIPGLAFPLVAIWGLNTLLKEKTEELVFKKGFLWALGITGGICLLIWIMPSLLLNFQSSYDAQFQGQVPAWYYPALLMDRATLASEDALRSLLFILLGAGLLVWFWKSKDRQKTATYVSTGMILLILIDLWSVDKRYLNDNNFSKAALSESFKASVADNAVLEDKDPSYRVLNLLNSPFQETFTSYFHKSVGGYHAAKLRRYQELIEHRLTKEISIIVNAFQNARSEEDLMSAFAQIPSLNMLNTRYIIYNPDQPPIQNRAAFGNAWFVHQLTIVENADAEIMALDAINPLEVAVVDKRFANEVKGFTPVTDPTATITLDNYYPDKLTYTSRTSSRQLAVFSEIYYQPGWIAYIDGKPAEHFRADWTLRAMLVPAGTHQITFEFRPAGFYAVSTISRYGGFFVLLLFISAIGYSVWQTRQTHPLSKLLCKR